MRVGVMARLRESNTFVARPTMPRQMRCCGNHAACEAVSSARAVPQPPEPFRSPASHQVYARFIGELLWSCPRLGGRLEALC